MPPMPSGFGPPPGMEDAVAVITVFRQAGCKGRYIAEKLAEALGCHFADYAIAERLMLQCGYARTPEVYQSAPDFWDRFTRRGLERDEINIMLRSVRASEDEESPVRRGILRRHADPFGELFTEVSSAYC